MNVLHKIKASELEALVKWECEDLSSENIAIIEEVITHKQIASEFFVIEVKRQITHCLFDVITFINDMVRKILFAIKFALISVLKLVKFVNAKAR